MASGPRLQVEQISTDDSTQALNVVFDETSGSIAIDYSPYYERISSASEATVSADYSEYYERIATAMESIATDVGTIKTLAETTGIKTVSPYKWMELVSIYKYLIDEGTLLQTNTASTEDIEQATEIMIEYLNKIKALPTGTD
jgi:hypothetical protein